jgi:anti-anti-sigma regulatory factor
LIIDLSEVTHIDAAGIDILVNAAARAGEADIALRIAGLHGAVKGLFVIQSALTSAWSAPLWSSERIR